MNDFGVRVPLHAQPVNATCGRNVNVANENKTALTPKTSPRFNGERRDWLFLLGRLVAGALEHGAQDVAECGA
jgi:hypothetical protein